MQIPRWPISSPDVMLLKVELSGDACNQLALWQRFRGSTVCNAAPRWLLIPGHVTIWGGTIVLVKKKKSLKFHLPLWAHRQPSLTPVSAERLNTLPWTSELLASTCYFIVFTFGLENLDFYKDWWVWLYPSLEVLFHKISPLAKLKGRWQFAKQHLEYLRYQGWVSRGCKEHLSID